MVTQEPGGEGLRGAEQRRPVGLCVPCQSSVCRKWLVSAPLLCGDSDSVGSASGDPVSASYWALEPGCLGSSGFPAGRGGHQATKPRCTIL